MTATPQPKIDTTVAVKLDAGKPRMDLIAPEALQALGSVLAFGANKYADRNWEKGMSWGRVYSALQRHLNAWAAGEDLDPESGMPHLWHAITNVHFLIAYEIREAGTDDRSPYAVSNEDIEDDDTPTPEPANDNDKGNFVDAVVGQIEQPDEDEDDDADLHMPPMLSRRVFDPKAGQWVDYATWVTTSARRPT